MRWEPFEVATTKAKASRMESAAMHRMQKHRPQLRLSATSLSGTRVARELDAIISPPGRPDMIVSDSGTEYTSNAILGWTDETGVGWHYIAPVKHE